MSRERWFQMAECFSTAASLGGPGETLCSRCQEVLCVTGVAISLISETNTALLCVSDEAAATLDAAQFTVGEGPSCEALFSGRPVFEDHLTSTSPHRWPALSNLTRDMGIEGIFAFPLQIGAARSGVLTLYQREAGAWSPSQHADGLIAADVLTHLILSIQAKAPEGSLADALREAGSSRAEVHQASGMLSAQLGVSVAEGLVRLRGLSFATERPVSELALAVIAHRLRLVRSYNSQVEWSED